MRPAMYRFGRPLSSLYSSFGCAAQLFETGVDEMSWDDLSQAKEDWPSIEAITDYRRKAYAIIKEVRQAQAIYDGRLSQRACRRKSVKCSAPLAERVSRTRAQD